MSVPSLELGPPSSHPLSAERVCNPPPPPNQRSGEHTNLRVRVEGHNSDDWRKSLVLCLLCGAGYPKGGETHGGQHQGRGHRRRDQLRLEVRRHGKILNCVVCKGSLVIIKEKMFPRYNICVNFSELVKINSCTRCNFVYDQYQI